MNKFVKFTAATAALVPALAMAAVDESVKASITASQADGLEVGWLIVGVFAAMFVIKLVKGMIR